MQALDAELEAAQWQRPACACWTERLLRFEESRWRGFRGTQARPLPPHRGCHR